MKKFLIVFAVVFLLLGVRLHFNGLSLLGGEGTFTVFHRDGSITVQTGKVPLLSRWDRPARLDIEGGQAEADQALTDLRAKTLWVEYLDGVQIIYAYSPHVAGYETVKNKRVNVMVAIGTRGVAIGTPLLKGSY